VLLVDVHPAEVTLPDGSRHDLVRVALTNRRLRIWSEVGRAPEMLFEAAHQGIALDTLHPLVGRSMTWATDAGRGGRDADARLRLRVEPACVARAGRPTTTEANVATGAGGLLPDSPP
jgi:hypothetical protein